MKYYNPFQSLLCFGAASATIETLPSDDCIERIGQVVKIGVQRTMASSGVENSMTIATTNPNLLATWNALKIAGDNTTVQFTPDFISAAFEPGEAIEVGGGNDSVGGAASVHGRNHTAFSSQFEYVKQTVIKSLKTYQNEKLLSAYLINADGLIWGISDDPASPTTFKGIPIARKTLFVGDKGQFSHDSSSKNSFMFKLPPNWSDYLTAITPSDFNALTQLEN